MSDGAFVLLIISLHLFIFVSFEVPVRELIHSAVRNPGGTTGPREQSQSLDFSQARTSYRGASLSTSNPLNSETTHMDRSGQFASSIGMDGTNLTQIADPVNGFQDNSEIQYWMSSSAESGSYGSQVLSGPSISPCTSDMAQSIHVFHPDGSVPISRECSQTSTEYTGSMQPLGSVNSNGSGLAIIHSPHPSDQCGTAFSPEHPYSMESEAQATIAGEYSYGQIPYTESMESSPSSTAPVEDTPAIAYPQDWTSAHQGSQLPGYSPAHLVWHPMSIGHSSSVPVLETPVTAASVHQWPMEDDARLSQSYDRPASMAPLGTSLDCGRFDCVLTKT